LFKAKPPDKSKFKFDEATKFRGGQTTRGNGYTVIGQLTAMLVAPLESVTIWLLMVHVVAADGVPAMAPEDLVYAS